MKQHKSKARSEKRVDYTVEVNIAEATEELCSQVVLEKLESEVLFLCTLQMLPW